MSQTKEEFIENYEKNHHKTAQRIAILEYLNSNKHHPNIIDIYKNVTKKLSSISMTTIYNTIDLLMQEGLIHEVAVRHHEERIYESNLPPMTISFAIFAFPLLMLRLMSTNLHC